MWWMRMEMWLMRMVGQNRSVPMQSLRNISEQNLKLKTTLKAVVGSG